MKNRKRKQFPCREFLQKLNAEASTIEELLDFYGAQKNREWFAFREGVAAQKLFTAVTYDMLHLESALGRYKLLETCKELADTTALVKKQLSSAIVSISKNLTQLAQTLHICDGPIHCDFQRCDETSFPEQLSFDRKVQHVHRVGETVVYLATRFLNLSEDRQVQELHRPRPGEELGNLVPDVITEEKCRTVEAGFHNLQSMYDSYIFESDLESQNRNLSYLRGHISIIYHLQKNATSLIHYYVRHMNKHRVSSYPHNGFPMSEDEILKTVFHYLFHYARIYMDSAVHLCRSMIQSYSVQKSISVPIPNYRGFHVRPSTLIAKIVTHYGSNVKMLLGGQEYNAASPLELFRANEEINAMKRKFIADILSKEEGLKRKLPEDPTEQKKELQMVFLDLIKRERLMLYELDLPFEEVKAQKEESIADYASRCIKHFQALAKLDVSSDLSVGFQGDNRSLNDLKILADHGYGEDKHGNNIVLPEELSYLRR